MGRGTIRRMVEGVSHALGDGGQYPIQVLHHVRSDEAENTIAVVFHVAVARGVALGPVAVIVRSAVHLDHQPRVAYEEIRNIWTDWVLVADFEAKSAPPKLIPQ